MVELDLLTQLGSLIKRDQINEPELNCGCFFSHHISLVVTKGPKPCDDFNHVLRKKCSFSVCIPAVTASEMKSRGAEVRLNAVARLLCRF